MTKLSPAAQAIEDAVDSAWSNSRARAAAALRAAACKAKVLDVCVGPGFFEIDEFIAVRDLIAIAVELENHG
jgi:hypothetical protein